MVKPGTMKINSANPNRSQGRESSQVTQGSTHSKIHDPMIKSNGWVKNLSNLFNIGISY
jgi:hypothetical protein